MNLSLGTFGDLRLDIGGAAILERMVSLKTVCLRRLGGDRSGELQFGRFLANPKVTVEKIINSWNELTRPAAVGRHVLAIQDTCEVKFPTTAQRRRGLGPVKSGNTYGVLIHSMIAVDAATGACLGLVGGDVWSRPGVATTAHRDRPLSRRESRRWLKTAEQARTVLAPASMMTVISDREGDIYPSWATVPADHCHLLVRAMANRRVSGGGTLFAAAAHFEPAGQREIEIRPHAAGETKRAATVGLRFGEVTVLRPRHEQDRSLPKTVTLRLIEVEEIAPPKGAEPVHWRLLTTHHVADAAAAWTCVDWYRSRWVIEQMHRVMKSQGLQLEDSQVASADRLAKLAAIATKAACIDIQLVQARDGNGNQPASNVFTEAEVETVAALVPTLEGKTERQKNTHPRGSLAWAGWCIARLGGWNCYYKPPGPITYRRGMEQFRAIHRGRLLSPITQQDVRIL
jgi:hypothetical protein